LARIKQNVKGMRPNQSMLLLRQFYELQLSSQIRNTLVAWSSNST